MFFLRKIIALVLLFLFGPIICIAFLISWGETRRSPIFWQKRVGRRGRRFCIWKLRTMRADGSIPPLCKFMRRMRIDELLQLINVYNGSMNFYGYRPFSVKEALRLNLSHEEKRWLYEQSPGILGFNPICAGDKASQHARVIIDEQRLRENWSATLAIIIIWQTICFLLMRGTDRNAAPTTNLASVI